MANEISMSVSLRAAKGGGTVSGAESGVLADMTGSAMTANVQAIGITTEALDLGDVGAPQALYLENQDETHFVEIANVTPVVSGTRIAKLLPGQACLLTSPVAGLYALADTAPVNLLVVAVGV